MKANVLTDWEKLNLLEIQKPIPQKGEVLIKVLYGGVCGSDVTVFHHRHLTATVPRIMCHEILGIVEEINTDAPVSYGVGDRVVVHPLQDCGVCDACLDGNFHVCKDLKIMGLHIDGGFAEYVCAQDKRVFPVADDIPDKVAILIEPMAVGFHACSRAEVLPGENVLIIGGGPIGICCAVCARYFGASKVVIAELNPERLELIQSFGFDVIDSGKQDLYTAVAEMTNGDGFDKVFEASGSNSGALALASVTKIRGVAVLVGIPSLPREYQTNKMVLKEVSISGSRVHTLKDFERAVEMVHKLYRSEGFAFERLISAEFELGELEEAIHLQESGTNNGKILIRIGKEK